MEGAIGSSVPTFGLAKSVYGCVRRSTFCFVLGVSEKRVLTSIALTALEISIFLEAGLNPLLSAWCWCLWLWLVECYLVAVSKAVVYGSFEPLCHLPFILSPLPACIIFICLEFYRLAFLGLCSVLRVNWFRSTGSASDIEAHLSSVLVEGV